MEAIQDFLPDDYLLELGHIAVQWSFFESVLDLCLTKLANIDIYDPRSMIIFTHITTPLKLDIFAAMCAELEGNYPRLKTYKDVLIKINAAKDARNKFVHAKWGIHEKTSQVEISRVSAHGKLKYSTEPIHLSKLRSASEIIHQAAVALHQLVISSGDIS